MVIDSTGWEHFERLPHGELYWIAPGVMVAVPDEGVVEVVSLSQAVYDGYTRAAASVGHPIAVLVYVDRLGDQTPEVRTFWQNVMHPDVVACVALISSSFFARAISSFFIGISGPKVPTKMLGTEESALLWAKERLAAHQ